MTKTLLGPSPRKTKFQGHLSIYTIQKDKKPKNHLPPSYEFVSKDKLINLS